MVNSALLGLLCLGSLLGSTVAEVLLSQVVEGSFNNKIVVIENRGSGAVVRCSLLW